MRIWKGMVSLVRTTDERIAAVRRRAKEIEKQKLDKRNKMITVSSVAACFMLIIGTAFALPGVVNNLADNNTVYVGSAASLFAQGSVPGYTLIGALAFALGVSVTVLCYRIRIGNKADEEHGDD